ncbi:amino acid permease [Rothia koreensis]|jgi:AAT family amino acid transporter|uniref:amino acid permease n=1 Tax=Rothia koreensis TaxID=592378 RepID=UPI0015B8EC88
MSHRSHSPEPEGVASPSQSVDQPNNSLKSRHLVMMALGSAIGTGLFVGTGSAIKAAGPAVIVSYLVGCLLLVLVMRALGEMAAADPASGSFSTYAGKALGPTAGRALGWLWWIQMVIVIAAESTAAAQIVNEAWPVLPQWVLALVFMCAFTLVNLLHVETLGETEFWFALLKVLAVLAFLVVGVLLLIGLLPTPSPGTSNLTDHGGFMPHGVSGVAAALLVVVFAFGGTELATIAAAETNEPAKNVTTAIRTILIRVLVFYVGAVAVMVLVMPWDDDSLSASPFVAVLSVAGLPGADKVMTVIIVLALLSALNANIYGGSRMLYSLARRGSAPRRFAAISDKGVPYSAVILSVLGGFVAVVLNYLWPEVILNIMLNIIGSTILAVWTFALISQIVLRKRAEKEGRKLPLKMWAFPWGSYLALLLVAVIVILGLTDTEVRFQLIATTVLICVIAILSKLLIKNKDASEFNDLPPNTAAIQKIENREGE